MNYELLYIIPATKTEEEVGKIKEEVTKIVGGHVTKILRDEMLGKLKLAYPIRHARYGHYVLMCFEAETSKLPLMERELNHFQDVLRFMMTRMLEGGETTPVKLVEYHMPDVYKKRAAKSVKKSGPTITAESADAAVTSGAATVAVSEGTAEAAVAAPLTEEQLDAQLDRILDGAV